MSDVAYAEKPVVVDTVENDSSDVRSALLRSTPENPALQRLRGRVLAGVDASEVITSYDRMHHRHNRS